MDDNFNHIPPSNPVYKRYNPHSIANDSTNLLVQKADEIWVENIKLKEEYGKLNKNIKIIPNCVDPVDVKRAKKYIKKNTGDTIRIGWTGGITHKDDLEYVLDDIAYIMKKYPNVVFVVKGGYFTYDFSCLPQDRIEKHEPETDWFRYIKEQAKLRIDIGLAPLVDHPFNHSKSPCKFYEYTMCGIPVLARGNSNMPYGRTIQDGKTGLLFKTKKQFIEKLEILINNINLRKELVGNATEDLANYSIKKHIGKYEESFGG